MLDDPFEWSCSELEEGIAAWDVALEDLLTSDHELVTALSSISCVDSSPQDLHAHGVAKNVSRRLSPHFSLRTGILSHRRRSRDEH